jgi:cytochrome P450
MQSLRSWLFYAARVGVYSEWHRLFFYVFRTFSNSTSGIAHVASFAKRRVNVFLHSSNPQLDKSAPMHFIARLLQVSEESPDKLGKEDIFAVCFANIGAGSDTTSIVMNTALHNIYKSPAVLERLRLELQNSGLCKGDPLSPLVPFQQAQRLPYLQAVIKESLRIHPPTGYPLTRVVPAGGASVAGHRIPSGVRITPPPTSTPSKGMSDVFLLT